MRATEHDRPREVRAACAGSQIAQLFEGYPHPAIVGASAWPTGRTRQAKLVRIALPEGFPTTLVEAASSTVDEPPTEPLLAIFERFEEDGAFAGIRRADPSTA